MRIFSSIHKLLSSGESFVLALVIDRSGSAPRSAGARMVVRNDESILGTVGGGILEAKVQGLAKEVFRDRRTVLEEFIFTAEDAGRLGMICGGRVKVLLFYLDALDKQNLLLYEEIVATFRARKRAGLVTEMPTAGRSTDFPAQWLATYDTAAAGSPGLETPRAAVSKTCTGQPELILHEGKHYLVEPLGHQGAVYIFGAGHISKELAPLTGIVGFETIVLDDRSDFANRERFPGADQIVLLGNFDRALAELEINEDSYLVFVTRGHAHDGTLLRQALGSKAGYIGMIGSVKKRNAIYDTLSNEGFDRSEFERVHAPIGLEIGAETPEEIAMSIVAELIQVRSEKNK